MHVEKRVLGLKGLPDSHARRITYQRNTYTVCECVRECVRECVMPSDNWLRKGERERTSQPAHMRYVDLARSIPTRSLSGK